MKAELDRIGYAVKERDIVLIQTGAGAYNTEERYRTDHPGMTARGDPLAHLPGRAADGLRRHHLRPAGVGDVRAKQFWEAHRVMWDEEYWHLENLMNLDQIGRPQGSR